MTIKKTSYSRGIILKADDVALDGIPGELKAGATSQRIHVYLEGATRTVVTEDQSQTLTNKTVVVANNIITTAASGNLAATELNTALAELQSDIDTRTLQTTFQAHIDDVGDAHDASAISNVPSGNLAATDVQGALNELQSDVDTRATQIAFQAHLDDTADAHDASAISTTAIVGLAGGLASDVQTVVAELKSQFDSESSTRSTNDTTLQNNIDNHINDTIDAHDASAISNIPAGNLAATDVQAALNELQSDIDTRALQSSLTTTNNNLQAHLDDTIDAHDASAISNIPAGNLAATDVQGALNELQSDIDTRATQTALNNHNNATTSVHGVTGNVVGTSDTQTLTNKTISANLNTITGTLTGVGIATPTRLDVKQDTKANLTTYAGQVGQTNGQIVFATDTKEMFQVLDGSLVAIGGAVTDSSFALANGQATAANITGLLIDPTTKRSFSVDYAIYRSTDDNALAQTGELRGVYNTKKALWFISDDFAGENSGVEFSITSTGQVQYKSTSISGLNYSGTLKYVIRKTFNI